MGFQLPRKPDRALRLLRQSLSLNQADFAELLGVAQQTLSAYETGVIPIPRTTFFLAWALSRLGEDALDAELIRREKR